MNTMKLCFMFSKKQILKPMFAPIQRPKQLKQSPDYKEVKKLFYQMNEEQNIRENILENHSPKEILKQIDTNFTTYFQKRNTDVKSINFLLQAIIAQNNNQQFKEAIQFINSVEIRPNLETYLWLITGFGKFRDIVNAEQYFEIAEQKFGLSLYLYNSLLNAYCKNKKHEDALKLFQDLQRNGFQPDLIIYTTLINTFYRVKKWDKCWELFDEARLCGYIKPDENLLGLMIEICADTHDAEKALNIYNQMQDMEFNDTTFVYNAIIKALGSRKDYAEKALEFYKRMTMCSIPMDSDTVVCTLKACSNSGDIKIAHEVLKAMVQNNILPNKYIYNQMIRVYIGVCSLPNLDSYIIEDYIRDAWKVFNEASSKGMITKQALNSMCELMVATDRFPDLEGLVLPLFDQYQIKKDEYTYEQIIKLLFQERRLLDVIRIFKEISIKMQPTFNCICNYLETAILLADEDMVIEGLEWLKKINRTPKYKYLKQLGTMKNIPLRIHAILDEYEAKFGKINDTIYRIQNNQRKQEQKK